MRGCIACLSLLVFAAHAEDFPGAAGSQLAALITDPALNEISGMTVSHRHPGLWWVHNDSDDGAKLYAIDTQGQRRSALTVRNATNTDWEDMAAFDWAGRSYLLIADTGDNGGLRHELALHVIAEPEQLSEENTQPEWSIHFRWPDGPRDCEAVAVDAAAGVVYLIAKKRVPPELWQVPLRPNDLALAEAQRVGLLAGVQQPTAEDLAHNPVFGRYRAQITGADLSRDGRLLAVLNYRTAYVYERRPGESWAAAVQHLPRSLPFPWLPQAEAIAFDVKGDAVWISSEKLPAALLRLPVQLPVPRNLRINQVP